MTQKKNNWKNIQQGTKSVWAGDTRLVYKGATQTPVVHSLNFGYEDVDTWFDVDVGKQEGHI